MNHVVDTDLFLSLEQLTAWQQALDDRGLRATGSPAHQDYVADLTARLAAVGAKEVHTEAMPMRRWTPSAWSLEVIGPAGDIRSAEVVSPVAYSGSTPATGVVGRLSNRPGPGVIGVVDVPLVPLSAGDFDGLDWGAPDLPVHDGVDGYDPTAPYERVWLSQDLMRQELARYEEAGAAGLVLVVDLPASELTDGYLLYDGVHRAVPALFVGRDEGRLLHAAAAADSDVRLVLEATVEDTETANVIGLIPGASDELVVLQSHTDGSNGLEDNGPEAILAMAHYLAALPPEELPRSVLVLLTTGHFALEEAWGLDAYLKAHRHDVVPRVAAAICVEHLGARAVETDVPAGLPVPEYEFGCCFATPHPAVIDAMRGAMDRARVTESRVLRPFVPDPHGTSPDGTTWPGDGGPFWHTAGLPSANFITGPGYLLNVEPVMDRIDVDALRRQAMAFTEATLQLASTPWGQLRQRVEVAS